MTKEELIQDLKAKSFIDDAFGEPMLEQVNEIGDKLYRINVRKIDALKNIVKYEHLYYWVINEGKVDEKAYYRDEEPVEIQLVVDPKI